MTRKSKPARSCPMCKPWKWGGNTASHELGPRPRDARRLRSTDDEIAEWKEGRHDREEALPGRR